MKNRLAISFGFMFAIVAVVTLFIIDNDAHNTSISLQAEKTVIAACPSCQDIATQLDPNRYEIIQTGSTAESITLLQKGRADAILSGRTLKPDEPSLNGYVIRDGYSFLSIKDMTIYESDLNSVTFYSDLEPETIQQSLGIEHAIIVDDVYQYLDKGIVVTSWDNTDYSRSAIVHVLTRAGDRLPLSRRPTLYCPGTCNDSLLKDIKFFIN